jgi:putative transposase
MTNTKNNDVEVLGPGRRRRWTASEKLAMVRETYEPGMSVSLVARRHGVNPNQLFQWRRLERIGALTAGVRVAFAMDCCDREVMSWIATTGGIEGAMVRDLMVEAVEGRFGQTLPNTPIEWLSDNGSPYVARDTRAFAYEIGLVPVTTAIRSPQSNGMAEALVKTFKRDYVAKMDRRDAYTVMLQLDAAFGHYNEVHPHSALKMLSPRMFRRKQAQLSNNECPEK